MFLYLVTMACNAGQIFETTMDLYVVAVDAKEASEKALNLMRTLKYKYDDYVKKVELLASVNTYRAKHLLVL